MSQQIQISGGAKVRDLQDVIIGTSGVLSSLAFNVANGVPKLDVNGKILVSQLPNSVMEYKGVWNAATNSPTLTNGGAFNQGDVYLCDTAGTVNFGSGPISFIVGDQAIYSGSVWQKAGGATGTVTSVGLSTNGGAITIGNSPITTSGVISANFNGTNLQYVNGAGNLTTFPTLMTSVGLTMPSAFTVTNSPLTGAGGTLAVTGAGTTAQYIRGDGSLATFPTIATEAQRLITEVYNETGATLTKGTVVYINGGHGNLPTITKAIATGDATSAQTYGIVQTDITNMNNGYVVVIGSLGDLDTQAYANGTQLYLSSTTAGAWTSVKQYAPAHLVYVGIVTRSHPTQGVVEVRIQNGFEMDELHNVSAQSPLNNQGLFYNTSTSLWENKSIATALGYTPANDALVVHNTGNETIGGTKTFSDATKNNGGIFLQNASSSSLAGYMNIGGLTNGVKFTSGGGVSNTFTLPSATGYTFTFPSSNGTLALTSDIPSITGLVPYTGATGAVNLGTYGLSASSLTLTDSVYLQNNKSIWGNNVAGTTQYNLLSLNISNKVAIDAAGLGVVFGGTIGNGTYTYTLPSATGTIALVGGSGVGTVTSVAALTIGTTGTDVSSTVANSTTTPVITLNVPTASATNRGVLASADWTTFNNKQGTITLTTTGTSGAATFSANTLNIPNYGSALSGYLPLTGGTLTGALGGTSASFSGNMAIGGTTITDGNMLNVIGNQSSVNVGLVLNNTNSTYARIYSIQNVNSNFVLYDYTASAARLTMTSGGNLGLGVTPSAWSGGFRFMDIGTGAGAAFGSVGTTADMTNNAFSDGSWTYKTTAAATLYRQATGQHQWFNAPSGTAGAAITFTQAMTLTAAGRLLLGTTTESTYLLDVNGTGRFTGNIVTTGTTAEIMANGSGSSNSVGGSSRFTILDSSNGRGWILQQNASYNLSFWHYNSGWSNVINFTPTGSATFSSSVQAGNNFVAKGTLQGYSGGGMFMSYESYGGRLESYDYSTSAWKNIAIAPNGGNVGIGTSSPEQLLSVAGGNVIISGNTGANRQVIEFTTSSTVATIGASYVGSSSFGDLAFKTSGTTRLTIASGGGATFTSSVTATSFFESSDSRLKTLIQDNYQTKGIASITPKLYTKNGKVELGYYAQDFVGVLDSAVSKGSDDMLSLSYREVHTAKIYALEQEIKELKAKMN